MTRVLLVAICIALPGCRDAFVAHVDVVARAEGNELAVNRLAEIVASAPDIPADPGVVELLAFRWVELALFAQRVAFGDSLLDSAMVMEAMWPSARGAVVDSFHTLLVAERVRVGAAEVDSVYEAGELRFIAHVLRRVTDSTPAEEREAQQARAERIRQALDDGGTWDEANEDNDDTVAASRRGGLGVLSRGATVPAFEEVAFGLAPGEMSPVTETDFGFHIIYRPPLADVREAFTGAVTDRFAARMDSAYQVELLAANRVDVFPNAAALMREAARFPLRSRTSDKRLVRFEGGWFLAGDFVRWLQILPARTSQQVATAPDDQLIELARSLVARELIWRQADSLGLRLTADQFAGLQAGYRAQIDELRVAMGIEADTLQAYDATREERLRVTALLVDRFLEQGVQDTRRLISVPPFLADQLLAEAEWEIDPAGVRSAVDRVSQLRAALRRRSTPDVNPGERR